MIKRCKPLLLTFSVSAMLGLGSCMTYTELISDSKLSGIYIVDRDGLSETITSKDRLSRYEKVNFCSPQPYRKVTRIFGRNETGDIISVITSYYPNGQLKQYLETVNNRAFGDYCEWYESGLKKVEATIIGGSGDLGATHENTWLFEGACHAWDEDGKPEATVLYEKGARQGFSVYYHKNGAIWKKIPFDKDVTHGTEETYLENGQLLQTCNYCRGEKSGEALRRWDENRIAARELFEKGKLQTGTYCDKEGKILSQITEGNGKRALFGRNSLAELHDYQDGIPEGNVELFTEKGELFNVFKIKNGMKHGEETEYYPAQQNQKTGYRKISISWFDGMIQGLVKTWYPNGNQESQREISKNEKNGLSTAWYEDGNLMMIEEYELDKLKNGKYFKQGSKMPVSTVKDGNGVATLFDSRGNFKAKVEYRLGLPEVL